MISKDTTQSFDSDFNRVMSNPDNLIMSDSLEDVVDFAAAEDPDVWGSSNFTCHFNFGDTVVAGALKRFSITKNQRTITITATDESAIRLLGTQELTGYVCKSIYDDVMDSLEANLVVEISVEFNDEQQTADVTVTIPRVHNK